MYRSLRTDRRAFTLVELLVVVLIIAILAALLFTGVQRVRDAARRTSCASNLRQIGLAMANYEGARGSFPPSWLPTATETNGRINGWSVWAILLPNLDQGKLYSNLDFDKGYSAAPTVTTADGESIKINALRVPTYICPSELRDEPKLASDGTPSDYPVNYGVNLGTWFIYNPVTKEGGPGAFFPGSRLKSSAFKDGLGFTICAAEVKAYQPNRGNAGLAGPLPMPTLPIDVDGLGGTFSATSGHSEWADGRSIHAGFTTTFRPNTVVPSTQSGDIVYDIDWINQREGVDLTKTTWAAITSRSNHDGVVNAVMMDASVRTFTNDINLGVWQAFSTRAGGELIPSKYQQP